MWNLQSWPITTWNPKIITVVYRWGSVRFVCSTAGLRKSSRTPTWWRSLKKFICWRGFRAPMLLSFWTWVSCLESQRCFSKPTSKICEDGSKIPLVTSEGCRWLPWPTNFWWLWRTYMPSVFRSMPRNDIRCNTNKSELLDKETNYRKDIFHYIPINVGNQPQHDLD